MLDIHNDKILILDFGSQVTQLIARRIRELNVYCEIHPYDITDEFVRDFAPKGIILSGSPNSTYEQQAPRAPQAVFELAVPVLCICYGMQAMAEQLGGKVESSGKREFGYAEIYNCSSKLLAGIIDGYCNEQAFMQVWMSHGDKVTKMPADFHVLASTPSCPIAGMFNDERRYYGVQ
ncbi:MAG: glutamine-hydrolyzing GMP synthase, partial [Burkholderiales bacterium]